MAIRCDNLGVLLRKNPFQQDKTHDSGSIRTRIVDVASAFVAAFLLSSLPKITEHPRVFWSLLSLSAFALLWILRDAIKTPFLAMNSWRENRKFIILQHEQLVLLFRRFDIFCSQTDQRSIQNVVADAVSKRADITNRLFRGDSLRVWKDCFGRRLGKREHKIEDFLQLSAEFTTLVGCFNNDYVQEVQKQLPTLFQFTEYQLAKIEQFREDFNAFLRDLEQFATEVNRYRGKRFEVGQNSQFCTSSFTRVPNLRRTSAANS